MMKSFSKKICSVLMVLLLFSAIFVISIGANASADEININEYSFPLLGKTATVTSAYGQRVLNGSKDYHNGIDLAASTGDSVLAWKDGVVADIKTVGSTSWGNYVILFHGYYDGKAIYTAYAHLDKILVNKGDTVLQQSKIGEAGNTGNSYGSHLHFEVYLNSCSSGKYRTNPAGYIGLRNEKGTQNVTKVSLVERVSAVPVLSIKILSNSKVKFSWESSASKFTVQKKEGNGEWKNFAVKTKSKGLIAKGLTPGERYSVRVKAFVNDKYTEYSNIESFLPLTKVKDTKVSFAKLDSDSKFKTNSTVNISWKAVNGATEYEIYRKKSGSSYTKVATTSNTSYSNNKLSGNKTYYYKVRAKNSAAKGEFSSSDSVTTMSTPKITSVQSKENTSVTLKVSKVKGAEKYRVYSRLASSSSDHYSLVASSPDTSITIKNLKRGKKYYFKVSALKGNVLTERSKVQSFQSLATGKITKCVLTSNTSVELKWNKIDGAKNYQLQYVEKVTGKKFSRYVKGTSIKINNLVPGRRYSFAVRGVRRKIFGNFSSAKIALPIATPKINSLELASTTSALLKWSSASGAEKYKIYRSVNGGKYKLVKTVSSSTRSYLDKGIKDKKTYTYYVVGIQGKIKSSNSRTVSIKTMSGKPALSMSDRSNSQIELSWTSVDGAKGYNLYRKTNDNSYEKIKSFSSKTHDYTDKTVDKGNSYRYIVKGFSGAVTTDASNSIFYKSLGAPSISTAKFTTTSKIYVNWSKVKGADGYALYQMVDGESWDKVYSGSDISCTINNAKSSSENVFRVRAYYKDGSQTYYGGYSLSAKATRGGDVLPPTPGISFISGDTWVKIKASSGDGDEDEYVYKYVYSKNKDSGYSTPVITYDNEYTFSNLSVNTDYYFKVKIMIPDGKDDKGNKKYIEGAYSSPKKITTHSRFLEENYSDLIDIGKMFGVTPIVHPVDAGPYTAEVNYYQFSVSELKTSSTSYIAQYKTAITEAGGSYSETTNNSSKCLTISINGFTFYLGYNNKSLVISDERAIVTNLI